MHTQTHCHAQHLAAFHRQMAKGGHVGGSPEECDWLSDGLLRLRKCFRNNFDLFPRQLM